MKTIYPTLLLTALIILSSHSVSAGLPKAVEIERQKRLMMEALSSDNCESAMKNLTKLEALQAQLPQDLTYYVKGKCYYKQGEYMRALQSLEAFFNQVESDHINYNKALDLYSVIENAEEERRKAELVEMVTVGRRGARYCYQMGNSFDDGYDNERLHKVCINGFKMATYEVTQRLWEAVMGGNPSHFKGCNECPVERVSWGDSMEFIDNLNQKTGEHYRLPTEAEWEYAARSGGKQEEYAGGDCAGCVAWHKGNSGDATHPVGQKQPNGLGLYDMSGNVWEWTSSDYDKKYSGGELRASTQGRGSGQRALRGGSWYYGPRYVRAATRYNFTPDNRYSNIGLRLAQDL
jgi:formylglycine-generating enzyme